MMFLILKIFIYLCVALGLGAAAGWLLRHVKAQKEVEELQRALAGAKAKVPKLEALLRGKEERIRNISKAQSEKDEVLKGSRVQDEQIARQLREKELLVQRLRSRIEVLEQSSGEEPLIDGALLASDEDSDNAAAQGAPGTEQAAAAPSTETPAITELNREIERLKEEVASTRIQLEVAKNDSTMRKEVAELTSRLRQKAEDYERLQKSLHQEQRKVAELERERELQNRSLKVLHQQLEMSRDSKA